MSFEIGSIEKAFSIFSTASLIFPLAKSSRLKFRWEIANLDLSMRLALSVNELQSLTQAMEKNHSIKTANLSNLGINADSAMHIADCLKVNQTLQQLNLTNMCQWWKLCL